MITAQDRDVSSSLSLVTLASRALSLVRESTPFEKAAVVQCMAHSFAQSPVCVSRGLLSQERFHPKGLLVDHKEYVSCPWPEEGQIEYS
jgi:hypothetical protein